MKTNFDDPPKLPDDGTNVAAWLQLNDFPYEIVDATLWRLWLHDMPDEELLTDEQYLMKTIFFPICDSYYIHDGTTQIVIHATIDPKISSNPRGYSIMESTIRNWIEERWPQTSDEWKSPYSYLFGLFEARPGNDEPGQKSNKAVIFMDVQLDSMTEAVRFFKKLEKFKKIND